MSRECHDESDEIDRSSKRIYEEIPSYLSAYGRCSSRSQLDSQTEQYSDQQTYRFGLGRVLSMAQRRRPSQPCNLIPDASVLRGALCAYGMNPQRLLSTQFIERLTLTRSQIVRLMATATSDRDQSRTLVQRLKPIERLDGLRFSLFHSRTATYTADYEEVAEVVVEYSPIIPRGSLAENECLL